MRSHRQLDLVEYRSKYGKRTKLFGTLEWMAAMCSHVVELV